MSDKEEIELCPKCGYDYCICHLDRDNMFSDRTYLLIWKIKHQKLERCELFIY